LLAVASARRWRGGGALLAVVGGGGAQVGVVQARAGEVALFARGLVAVVGLEALADDVEHEQRVDGPDAAREVAAAVERPRVASVGGAVAQPGVDPELQRARAGLRRQGVELAVEPFRRAAEQARGLPARSRGEVGAGALERLGGVEQGAVVDPDRVDALVLDDGPVHERAEVSQRALVQVGAGDAGGDGGREFGCEFVHVGQAVGHRHRQLRVGRAFGHARAHGVGQGELAAQVVGLAGADAKVGADGGDPVLVAQAGARGPAVAELRLLVGEREVLALVLVGLDAADLLRRRLVVEQQHDQAADRRDAVERVARFGGE
jgi:hypothetical protein